MRRTEPAPVRAAPRRPGFCAALLICAALAPAPVAAQTQSWSGDPRGDAVIERMVDDGFRALDLGDTETALDLFRRANDITFETEALGTLAQHLPNLALARLNFETGDWDEMARFAASVATALNVDGLRDHPYRVEAMAFQGVAARANGNLNEADLILRAAYAASAGRPELLRVHNLAHYHLAAVATQLNAPDASDLRVSFLSGDAVPDGWVGGDEVAGLLYAEMFQTRGAGDPDEDVALFTEFLSIIERADMVSPDQLSSYRGFLGMLLVDAGRFADALVVFRARDSFLMKTDGFTDDVLWNRQRMAMALRNSGDEAGALALLRDTLEQARVAGLHSGILAILQSDVGRILLSQGQVAEGQALLRQAYAILRETRPLNDPDVLMLRELIALDDPGMAGFAFAAELGAGAAAAPALDPAAEIVLAAFLRRGYPAAAMLIDGQSGDQDDPVAVLLSRGMVFALGGLFTDAQDQLEQARAAAVADPAGTLSPDAPIFDLLDALSRTWGSDHAVESAAIPMARLGLRLNELSEDRRSLYFALGAYAAYRLGDYSGRIAMLRDWRVLDRARVTAPGPWGLFAQAVIFETQAGAQPGADSDAMHAALQARLADRADAAFLRDYAALIHLGNGGGDLSEAARLGELANLRRSLSDMLPASHALVSFAEHAIAGLYAAQGRREDALDWIDRTATTLRGNPFHNPDALAFLLAEQAGLLLALGDVNRAALIAGQAYDLVDLHGARPGFVAEVVLTLARAQAARAEDPAVAAEILTAHVADPGFFGRIAPQQQVATLLTLAEASRLTGDWEEIAATLERAEAIVAAQAPLLDGMRGWVAWTRALAEYAHDRPGLGYDAMVQSNGLARRDGAGGAATAQDLEIARARAVWEALIGWDVAQALPDSE